MKDLLFLTACINPGNMPFTSVLNSEERQNQYEMALNWYLKNTTYDILFVENSGTDISAHYDKIIKTGRLEILTFNGNSSFDKCLGKGYGEALIIEYALKRSVLINKCDRVAKISGRLKLLNINSILRFSRKSNTIYVNTEKFNDVVFATSRFFIVTREFLDKCFIPRKERINDSKGYFFEHLLYESINDWCKLYGYKRREFFLPQCFEGVSGTSGVELKQKNFIYLKALVKYFMHSLNIYYNHKTK